MNVSTAIAEILKREGISFLIGYPVNPVIEAVAEADIRISRGTAQSGS